MSYSIKEILTLETMLANGFSSKSSSASASVINKLINKDIGSNIGSVSISTTRKAILKFSNDGFLERGLNNGKNKTYFITETGRNFLLECIGEE